MSERMQMFQRGSAIFHAAAHLTNCGRVPPSCAIAFARQRRERVLPRREKPAALHARTAQWGPAL